MSLRRLKNFKISGLFACLILFVVSKCIGQLPEAKKRIVTTTIAGWKVIGPGGGGGVFMPVVSPFNNNLLFVHCDMTGAYRTENGGKDWEMFNLGTVPTDFKFDPVDSNTVYAATQGYRYGEERGSGLSVLFRSVDKGKTWTVVYPAIDKIDNSANVQGRDYLPSDISTNAFNGSIDKITVDPLDNKKIYLGLSPLKSFLDAGNVNKTSDSCQIIVSMDYGSSWKLLAKIAGRKVKGIFVNIGPGEKELIAFTETAASRINRQTGAETFINLPVEQIIAVRGAKGLFYIQSEFKNGNNAVKGGMYLSKDFGGHWKTVNTGLLEINGTGIDLPSIGRGFGICDTKPGVAYLSVNKFVLNARKEKEKIYCIYKTVNAGWTWAPVLLSSTPGGYITKNFSGAWMEKSFDPGWGESPIDLGVAPGNPDICFATDEGRAYKSTNGGKSWFQIYTHMMADSTYASNGLDVTTCYGMHFDPFDKSHFFICYTDIGLFHTFNGGNSWVHSISGVPFDWQNTCYDVAFDPAIKGILWSVWANAHDLPREKMFSRNGFDRFSGGVASSVDGGRTWNKKNNGIPENAVCTNILLDASSPAGNRILYVAVFGNGVYKTSDGGNSWEKKNNGLSENLFAWELRQNSAGRLFLLCPRGKKGDEVVEGAIYFSDDGAQTWKKLPLPEGVTGPHDLMIDPSNRDIMYVSCWPHRVDGKDRFGGVIKTTDGGASWKKVFNEAIRVNSSGIDPVNHDTIFINTFQNAAWQSNNAGETWKKISGYNFKWGQRAIPDPYYPGMIYLSTYGGSVYYGPVNADSGNRIDAEVMPSIK